MIFSASKLVNASPEEGPALNRSKKRPLQRRARDVRNCICAKEEASVAQCQGRGKRGSHRPKGLANGADYANLVKFAKGSNLVDLVKSFHASIAKIGVDTAENGPLKVCQKLANRKEVT